MADKNNTSSLLEAIKNKLSKFDNKPKPENKSSVNYFSQDLKNKDIDGRFVDKTNIELIFDAEKKLENSSKANQKAEEDYQKNLDLDIDDESLDVKNLGQKISIESKIKEIADELNLEEFEDDFEDEKTQENNKKETEKNSNEDYKNLDPIDIELMELEKEVNKNNQQKSQKISDEKTNQDIKEDLDLKNFLDSKFEDEFNEIEENIKNDNKNTDFSKKTLDTNYSADSKDILEIDEKEKIAFPENKNQIKNNEDKIFLNITPAQDFLASMSNKIPNEIIAEQPNNSENFVEQNQINTNQIIEDDLNKKVISDTDFVTPMSNKIPNEIIAEQPNNSENFVEQNQFNTNQIIEDDLNKKVISDTDFVTPMSNKIPNEIINEIITEQPNNSENFVEQNQLNTNQIIEDDLNKKVISDTDFVTPMSNKIPNEIITEQPNNSENFITKQSFKTNIAVEDFNKNNQEKSLQKIIKNEEIVSEKNIIDYSYHDSQNLKLGKENIETKDVILEKINYNLIREETVYQASNSMKKLMEAKNLVNNVGKFSQDETLTKIAMNLMEPKLEKWLNDNLPALVENIVREEIEKIVPKN